MSNQTRLSLSCRRCKRAATNTSDGLLELPDSASSILLSCQPFSDMLPTRLMDCGICGRSERAIPLTSYKCSFLRLGGGRLCTYQVASKRNREPEFQVDLDDQHEPFPFLWS